MTADRIIFDAREQLTGNAASTMFVGIKEDQAVKPFCAVTLHESRRFASEQGAWRWFTRQTKIKQPAQA